MHELGPQTSLRLESAAFLDLLDHLSHLVTDSEVPFDEAVPEALAATITNGVMDLDGAYAHHRALFTADGAFVDAGAERAFTEELRALVTEPAVLGAWIATRYVWVTPAVIRALQQAAADT